MSTLSLSRQELKRRASYHFYKQLGRPLKRRKSLTTRGIPMVAGLLSSPIGLGAGARLVRRGLELSGYDVSVCDLTPYIQPHMSEISVRAGAVDDGLGPIILHVNPAEVPKAIHLLRNRGLSHRRMIGVWAWELERLPKSWKNCENWFDEIWSISEFSLPSLQTLETPAVHVGYPIPQAQDDKPNHWRDRLGIADKFSVLMSFDAQSSLGRKNPMAAIKAFNLAFPNPEDAQLVIKITGDYGRFAAAHPEVFNATNTVIVDEVLLSWEMIDLIRSCDCFISLTRAEGFGLTVAEAAANGVPTIVTGWSAPADWIACPNMHFVDFDLVAVEDEYNIYDNITGRRWADPNVKNAAMLLNQVKDQGKSESQKLAHQAKQWWHKHHGVEAFKDRLSDATQNAMVTSKTSEH